MTASPVARSRRTRLQLALALNTVIIVVQVIGGFAAHSIGLLADAGHNLTDVAALVVSIIAVRLATRAPTGRHSFGYHRATILAAQLNAASILVVTVVLVIGAARRLGDPGTVHGGTVAVIAAIGLAANLGSARVLHEHSHDLNMRSALLHMMGDALASLGVLIAGLAITWRSGLAWLDPAISIVIALFIAWRAVALLKETTSVLLEGTPTGVDLGDIRAALRDMAGVEDVHDLHAWSLSSDLHALSAHLVVSDPMSLEEAQAQASKVKALLWARFAIGHATIELEQAECATAEDPCVDVERREKGEQHEHGRHEVHGSRSEHEHTHP